MQPVAVNERLLSYSVDIIRKKNIMSDVVILLKMGKVMDE